MDRRIRWTMARLTGAALLLALAVLLFPGLALAQEAADPGSLYAIAEAIPYGVEIAAVLVAICGLLMVAIPDDAMPGWLSKTLNFIALNFGKAKNDPTAQRPKG